MNNEQTPEQRLAELICSTIYKDMFCCIIANDASTNQLLRDVSASIAATHFAAAQPVAPEQARQIRDAFMAGAKSATVDSPMYEDLWQAAILYSTSLPTASLASPQVKGYSVQEVRALMAFFGDQLAGDFRNESRPMWHSEKRRMEAIDCILANKPPASLSAKGEAADLAQQIAALYHELPPCPLKDHLAKWFSLGEAPKEDAVQRTACDYRNLECSNTGEMAGGKWVCSNHKVRIQDPRKGKGTVFAAPEGTVSAPVEERKAQPFEKYLALSAAIEYGANNWRINTGWTELLQEINATITKLEAAAPKQGEQRLMPFVFESQGTKPGWFYCYNDEQGRNQHSELHPTEQEATAAYYKRFFGKGGEQPTPFTDHDLLQMANAWAEGTLYPTPDRTSFVAGMKTMLKAKPNPEPLVAALRHADIVLSSLLHCVQRHWIEPIKECRSEIAATLTQWEASQPSPEKTVDEVQLLAILNGAGIEVNGTCIVYDRFHTQDNYARTVEALCNNYGYHIDAASRPSV